MYDQVTLNGHVSSISLFWTDTQNHELTHEIYSLFEIWLIESSFQYLATCFQQYITSDLVSWSKCNFLVFCRLQKKAAMMEFQKRSLMEGSHWSLGQNTRVTKPPNEMGFVALWIFGRPSWRAQFPPTQQKNNGVCCVSTECWEVFFHTKLMFLGWFPLIRVALRSGNLFSRGRNAL